MEKFGDGVDIISPGVNDADVVTHRDKVRARIARSMPQRDGGRTEVGGHVARPLRIGIARLNKAIAEYSLARLEFTLQHPTDDAPPVLQRVGTQPSDEPAMQSWVDLMKRIAIIQSFVDAAKGADTRLALEPVFERLTKAAMHRRRFGGAIG